MASSSSASRFASAMSGFFDAPIAAMPTWNRVSKCPGRAAASGRSMASASSNRPALNKACAFAVSAAADRLATGGDGGSLPALQAVAGRSRNAEAASTRRSGSSAIVCYFLNVPKSKEKEA